MHYSADEISMCFEITASRFDYCGTVFFKFKKKGTIGFFLLSHSARAESLYVTNEICVNFEIIIHRMSFLIWTFILRMILSLQRDG